MRKRIVGKSDVGKGFRRQSIVGKRNAPILGIQYLPNVILGIQFFSNIGTILEVQSLPNIGLTLIFQYWANIEGPNIWLILAFQYWANIGGPNSGPILAIH